MKRLLKQYEALPSNEGLNWYRQAHVIVQDYALRFGKSIEVTAGVISALSPSCSWEQNLKDAEAILEKRKGYKPVTYGRNVVKAVQILEGSLDTFEAFNMKTSPKTYNFLRNILYPESPDWITIDRHAFRIATGEKYDRVSLKQYREISEMYRRAAKKIGLLPCELQAMLWVNFRK